MSTTAPLQVIDDVGQYGQNGLGHVLKGCAWLPHIGDADDGNVGGKSGLDAGFAVLQNQAVLRRGMQLVARLAKDIRKGLAARDLAPKRYGVEIGRDPVLGQGLQRARPNAAPCATEIGRPKRAMMACIYDAAPTLKHRPK